MTSTLTSEKVLREIGQLDSRAASMQKDVDSVEGPSAGEIQAAYRETLASLRWARNFASSNRMDFKQIEVGLMELRASLSAIDDAVHDAVRKEA